MQWSLNSSKMKWQNITKRISSRFYPLFTNIHSFVLLSMSQRTRIFLLNVFSPFEVCEYFSGKSDDRTPLIQNGKGKTSQFCFRTILRNDSTNLIVVICPLVTLKICTKERKCNDQRTERIRDEAESCLIAWSLEGRSAFFILSFSIHQSQTDVQSMGEDRKSCGESLKTEKKVLAFCSFSLYLYLNFKFDFKGIQRFLKQF